jgi:EAL domain-containing protein (putative c-di-GMP-specific phosphodiesterase class I)
LGPATPTCEGRKGEGNDLGRISGSAIAPAEVGTRHRKSNSHPMDAWALREAEYRWRVYAQLPVEEGPNSVGLSQIDIKKHGAVDYVLKTNLARLAPAVRRALEEAASRRAKLDPALLELEMTEGIAAGNSQRTIDLLNQLHALGVALSIDDFGTGYSSLSYLKRFNIDRLKIDQSFVRDLGHDAEDTAIVTAIIGMAIPRPATYGAGPQALLEVTSMPETRRGSGRAICVFQRE